MWDIFYNPYEWIAVLAGIVSVFFSYRKSILTYPFGIVSVSLYVYLCYSAGIYADMGINIFYFVMSIVGWINWNLSTKQNKLFIATAFSSNRNWQIAGITLLIWLAVFYVLSNCTDSNVPIIDALTTALCITGMVLMAVKKIENWIYFLIADVISIPLYAFKELYISSILFIILSIFAVLGFLNWRKTLITDK